MFSDEENLSNIIEELISSSQKADKPDKEDSLTKPYRFPMYLREFDPGFEFRPNRNSPITFVNTPSNVSNNPFKIDPQGILQDGRTTCMIKNIPNKFTATMLVDFVNETHFGEYDFLYLRMDFKNKCNVGYAFINFISAESVMKFYLRVNGQRWKSFASTKIAELTYASVQGLENLVRKFRKSSVMMEAKLFRPKVFYTEGPMKGREKNVFE